MSLNIHKAEYCDDQNVRYRLVAIKEPSLINWVFIPGDPGADSRYLMSLINILELPGN